MKIDPLNQLPYQPTDVFDLDLDSKTISTEEKTVNASGTLIPFTMITVSVAACGRSINGCK